MSRTVVVGSLAILVLAAMGAASVMGHHAEPASSSAPTSQGVANTLRTAQTGGPDLMLDARTMGSPTAPIAIYDVSDFQCPYCRDFWAQTLPKLEQEYINTGKARLTFINFPIPQLHPNAPAAHEFAMCAASQHKFWPVHNLLYAHQATWAGMSDPSPYFRTLADSAHMAIDALSACLQSGNVRGLLQAEAQASWQAGVKSTPSFIIQGVMLAGFAPITDWRPILDSIYAARTGGTK